MTIIDHTFTSEFLRLKTASFDLKVNEGSRLKDMLSDRHGLHPKGEVPSQFFDEMGDTFRSMEKRDFLHLIEGAGFTRAVPDESEAIRYDAQTGQFVKGTEFPTNIYHNEEKGLLLHFSGSDKVWHAYVCGEIRVEGTPSRDLSALMFDAFEEADLSKNLESGYVFGMEVTNGFLNLMDLLEQNGIVYNPTWERERPWFDLSSSDFFTSSKGETLDSKRKASRDIYEKMTPSAQRIISRVMG